MNRKSLLIVLLTVAMMGGFYFLERKGISNGPAERYNGPYPSKAFP